MDFTFINTLLSWHSFLIDQSRRASFASVRQSSMETPPNATPQPFRQPVSVLSYFILFYNSWKSRQAIENI